MSARGSLIAGERVHLRRLRSSDRDEFLERVRASRELHHPWSAPPDTPEEFDLLVRKGRQRSEERLLVCRNDDGAILGQFGISQIFYGPFCSAYLGYYGFVPFSRQGYMREGLALVTEFAFEARKLHRLQANVQPENAPSIALVRGGGFTKEGFSRRYLKIDGAWRDHEQWAILAEDPRP
ncbi:MAG: [ribosomal protein S5]-alanine N-acetyltransferase [Actinomycetota bacterium]|nr:[ribosomal protein S5]-alanine N-acetyltransferase [Actinomycetota bacterium]